MVNKPVREKDRRIRLDVTIPQNQIEFLEIFDPVPSRAVSKALTRLAILMVDRDAAEARITEIDSIMDRLDRERRILEVAIVAKHGERLTLEDQKVQDVITKLAERDLDRYLAEQKHFSDEELLAQAGHMLQSRVPDGLLERIKILTNGK